MTDAPTTLFERMSALVRANETPAEGLCEPTAGRGSDASAAPSAASTSALDHGDNSTGDAGEGRQLIGHNSEANMAKNTIAGDELRLFIERIERLEEEKKGIADDLSDVYSEAKGRGYDVKIMRECVKLRRMEREARQERETLLRVYGEQLGLFD